MLRSAIGSLVGIVTFTGVGATQEPVRIPASAEHELRTKATRQTYRLFVSLPQAYSKSDTMRYPVLYVLDGNGLFPIAVGAYRYLKVANEVPDLIIIGVGYTVDFPGETGALRWTDLTPSHDPRTDSIYVPRIAAGLRDKKPVPLRSGGAAALLSGLQSEIMPLVDRTYRTSNDRALLGHSFGGLFSAYVLFTTPEKFSRYALLSPTMWWDGGHIYTMESAFAANHRDLNARVFVSVGGQEGAVMMTGTDSLARILKGRGYAGLGCARFRR